MKGLLKEQWGLLTDDQLERLQGIRDQLVGRAQQRYAFAKDEDERQVRQFEPRCRC